eukprot:gnl/Chilomastix_cuspidata/289.p1 GENE.gnl/Chilomastix_cuspidata/289~~gnl/Chilomastix_cuspidata/289.p1  ORF type:complete len:1039 (-),score=218.99 gnl/Chilomastix_cuspidata/289:4769-7885(-)
MPADSKPGEVLNGNYRLGNLIGKGASAEVFKALNIHTGQTVAIKQIPRRVLSEEQIEPIREEIRLFTSLSHPNVVKYIGSEETAEFIYIILEFVEGGSLQSLVKKFGQVGENLAAAYTEQILEGLSFLHAQGLIHRDIKGANILATKEGGVKLSDFGISILNADTEGAVDVAGTPYWMAPEVIEMSGLSTTSDIWSVGSTVIELLTGHPPYADLPTLSALYRIVKDDHPPLPELVSDECKEFLLQCFVKDPSQRPSADTLLASRWITRARQERAMSGVKTIAAEDDDNFFQDEQIREIRGIDDLRSRLQVVTQGRAPASFSDGSDDFGSDFGSDTGSGFGSSSFGTSEEESKVEPLRGVRLIQPNDVSVILSHATSMETETRARAGQPAGLDAFGDDESSDEFFGTPIESGSSLATALKQTMAQQNKTALDQFDVSSEDDGFDSNKEELFEKEIHALLPQIVLNSTCQGVLERLYTIFETRPPMVAYFRSHLGLYHLLKLFSEQPPAELQCSLIKLTRSICIHQPDTVSAVCSLGFLPHIVRAAKSKNSELVQESSLFHAALITIAGVSDSLQLWQQKSMLLPRNVHPQPNLINMLIACGGLDSADAFLRLGSRNKDSKDDIFVLSCKFLNCPSSKPPNEALAFWSGVELVHSIARSGCRAEILRIFARGGVFELLSEQAARFAAARAAEGKKWYKAFMKQQKPRRGSPRRRASLSTHQPLEEFYRHFHKLMSILVMFATSETGTKKLCSTPSAVEQLVKLFPTLLKDTPASSTAITAMATILSSFSELERENSHLYSKELIGFLTKALELEPDQSLFSVHALHSLCRFEAKARRISASVHAPPILARIAQLKDDPRAEFAAETLISIARDHDGRQVALKGDALEFFFTSIREGGTRRFQCLDILEKGIVARVLSGRNLVNGTRGEALAYTIHRPPPHQIGQLSRTLCQICVRSPVVAKFLSTSKRFVDDLMANLRTGDPTQYFDSLNLLRQIYLNTPKFSRFLTENDIVPLLRSLSSEKHFVLASNKAAEMLAECLR